MPVVNSCSREAGLSLINVVQRVPADNPGPVLSFLLFSSRNPEYHHFLHFLDVLAATQAQAALNHHFIPSSATRNPQESQESRRGTNR